MIDSTLQNEEMDRNENVRSAAIGILKPTLRNSFDNATPDVLNDTDWENMSGKANSNMEERKKVACCLPSRAVP